MKRLSILIIAVSLAAAVSADVIYDDQTYDEEATWSGYWIYEPCEGADDFELSGSWVLELVRFWVLAYGPDPMVIVNIYDDSGSGPGNLLFSETVYDETWTIIEDNPGYDIYQVDVPITGFDIVPGTRYWLGLHTSARADLFWLTMPNNPDWWSNCYYYDGETWYDSYEFEGRASAFEFELHGTPADTAVEPASLGAIKAGFAE